MGGFGQKLAVALGGVVATPLAFVGAEHLEGRLERVPLQKDCTVRTLPAALSCLRRDGVGVVEGVVDARTLKDVRATSVYESMPEKMKRRVHHRGSTVKDLWPSSSDGRYHRREESFDAADLEVFERLERALRPFVLAFFDEDEASGTRGIYRSELQVLNACPGGTAQAWHRDNHSRGVTIIVPLVDFTVENGATQLLLGSHEPSNSWPTLTRKGAQIAVAPLHSIIAYDSRTFHRGLGNATDSGRPAIIFCYDREWSPPPGCGDIKSTSNAQEAKFINLASAAYRSLAA